MGGLLSDPDIMCSMLPTLGLTKYKQADLTVNQSNPYSVHEKTEMMLIHKERERGLKDFNRMEKDAMHLAQKGRVSRPDRKGVIATIKSINKSSSGNYFDGSGTFGQQAVTLRQPEIKKKDVKKGQLVKQNIFEEIESRKVAHQRFKSLGYTDQEDAVSRYSKSSHTSRPSRNSKAIEYLTVGQESRENAKDYIAHSRNILMSQININ